MLTGVRELTLSSYESLPLRILGFIAPMTWLESLTLERLASFTARYNLRFLRGFSQLRSLQLSWVGVFGVYFDFLPQLTNLRDLRVACGSRCTFSVESLRYLTEMTWLVSLQLENTQVQDPYNGNVISFAESLSVDERSLSIKGSRVKVCELLDSIRSRWQ